MIFISGGSGLVGSHIILELLKKGEQVLALKREKSDVSIVHKLAQAYKLDLNFDLLKWVVGDLSNYHVLADAMSLCDEVYHCAAKVSFHPKHRNSLYKYNVEGTANMVNAALQSGIKKFAHISSTAAIGAEKNTGLITEKTAFNEENPSNYSLTKRLAEMEVWRGAEEGLNVVIVNPCIIIGPGFWGKSSTSLFKQVANGLKFYPGGSNAVVSVDDVAKTTITLMEKNIFNDRFLVIGENLSFQKLFSIIAKHLDKKEPSIKLHYKTSLLAAKILGFLSAIFPLKLLFTEETVRSGFNKALYSNQKIKNILNLEFTSADDAIKKTAEIYRSSLLH